MSIRIEDLAKTDFRSVTVAGGKRIAPTSPGEMLRDEFLKPLGLTDHRLAKEIDVPAQRIGDYDTRLARAVLAKKLAKIKPWSAHREAKAS
jgi:hypothetical protein